MEKAMHKRDQCMECSQPPVYEILFAEGMAHAWWCEKHFKEWATEHLDDIDYIKEVKDGEAASKFAENRNPNIKDEILEKFGLKKSKDESKEEYSINRTNRHIASVQKAIDKIATANPEFREFDGNELIGRGKVHDASKFKEPEKTPYVYINWKHKCENEGKAFECPEGMQEKMNEATLHHIKSNRHHPVYHLDDKSKANISSKDRDKSDVCVNATNMPALDIAEMCADWQGMSEELGRNTARDWYNKQKDVRWHFSESQNNLIDKLLKVFENVKKSNVDEIVKKIDVTSSKLEEINQSLLNLKKDLEMQFQKGYTTAGNIDYKKILYSADVKYLNKLSKVDLRILHKKVHDFYGEYQKGEFKDLGTLLNVHLLTVQEMENRNIEHERIDKLDFLSLPMKSYDVLQRHETIHDSQGNEAYEEHVAVEWQMKQLGLKHINRDDTLDNFIELLKKDIPSSLWTLVKDRPPMVLQTVILSKERYKTKQQAISRIKDLGFKVGDIEETEDSWRFRQRNPKDFRPGNFRTKQIAPGVTLITGWLKKSELPKTKSLTEILKEVVA